MPRCFGLVARAKSNKRSLNSELVACLEMVLARGEILGAVEEAKAGIAEVFHEVVRMAWGDEEADLIAPKEGKQRITASAVAKLARDNLREKK
jgi:hypothetical protein